MPNQHKHRPIPFRPPEGDRARLLAYAEQTEQPVNRILAAALAAYLDAAESEQGSNAGMVRPTTPPTVVVPGQPVNGDSVGTGIILHEVPEWGVIHADGHEETSDVVTTRQSARDWVAELDEDCDCGGPHRVSRSVSGSRGDTCLPGKRGGLSA